MMESWALDLRIPGVIYKEAQQQVQNKSKTCGFIPQVLEQIHNGTYCTNNSIGTVPNQSQSGSLCGQGTGNGQDSENNKSGLQSGPCSFGKNNNNQSHTEWAQLEFT